MNNNLKEIIIKHHKKYPLMKLEDVFKLIYQNEFGGEHLINDKDSFIDYLKKEKAISNDNGEIIDIGNNLVRIDVSLINDVHSFTDEFVLSFSKSGSIDSFINKINIVKELIFEGKLPYTISEVDFLLDKFKENNFLPISHSEIYKQNYHPHYRIIDKKLFLKLNTNLPNK